jgi:hypothetical protein
MKFSIIFSLMVVLMSGNIKVAISLSKTISVEEKDLDSYKKMAYESLPNNSVYASPAKDEDRNGVVPINPGDVVAEIELYVVSPNNMTSNEKLKSNSKKTDFSLLNTAMTFVDSSTLQKITKNVLNKSTTDLSSAFKKAEDDREKVGSDYEKKISRKGFFGRVIKTVMLL